MYFAQTGTAFPAVSLGTPGSAWVEVGYTEGGVKVASPQNVVELRADQVTGPIKAVRSEESLEISFSIASLTLENYALTMNRAIGQGIGVGNKNLAMYRGGFQVETLALLIRGNNLSPYGNTHLQFEVPNCFQADSPEVEFTKDNKATLSCSFHAIVDPDRADDDASFGYLRTG